MLETALSQIDPVVRNILNSYDQLGGINHIGGPNLPSRQRTIDILQMLRSILFPGYYIPTFGQAAHPSGTSMVRLAVPFKCQTRRITWTLTSKA